MKHPIWITGVIAIGLMISGCGGGGGGTDNGDGPPAPQPQNVVQGHVKDATDQSGVGGAQVTVGGRSDTTDASGYYRITNVPTGSRQVAVTPPGGYSLAAPVSAQQIDNGTNTIPDIFLVPDAQGPPQAPTL